MKLPSPQTLWLTMRLLIRPMRKPTTLVHAALAMTLMCSACGAPEAPESDRGELTHTARRDVTFEEFLSTVQQDSNGRYVYDGDMPARDLADLRRAWEQLYPKDGALTVSMLNAAADNIWKSGEQLNMSYCVSNDFGASKQAVVNAMSSAGTAWGAQLLVNFVYVPAQDANCTNQNTNVFFNVSPITSAPYSAQAFMPGHSRPDRTIFITSSAFSGTWPLTGILMHELGHTLGLRHEFLRSGMCYASSEPQNWRGVTTYDAASIMNYPYPECGGTGGTSLTQRDVEGVSQLYGSRVLARPVAPTGCGHLPVGKGLGVGEYLYSCDRMHFLTFRTFGVLELVKVTFTSTSTIYQTTWSTEASTGGQGGYGLYMQGDGNLVIYTGLMRPLWHTSTGGQPGSSLAVQNDGNVVIYSPQGQALWNTGTWGQ
ncbi:hypothetical protein JYK02_32175 [Corallococcus macrosporus]|uniref:Bulb-type lectin domain-containing protein n=1 Tax=Corallococcus macrosporus TaxID=35 RepID=A0ABS3DLH9_9BACT|nr:M57 family metalloprotease [Corallococcus macrosporus]MBN8232182.1 hypothetical protein [Corallococcus macrosporus]